ncbi:extradiol dioxygenase [Hymenobacter qilianensis]|uniref:Extradiol dioxygenase n=2 Tax=Hymenobacter qilianensis TaxID=1385715 RepID=A0ACB5PLA7_9BACT|nr:VOC family protein [Hymenobacter qilianensis]QNP50973.1 VOC family protein [Hymenobacter qilianensis]GGF48941.1 extradiol dioxygenase [Hymenobacter qilianensis]
MATQIFVNLPVKDLFRSVEFFTKLGYRFNQQFTDENATCMIVGENIYVMLLVEPFFQTLTKKEIVDATKSTEAIICLSADSREQVDEMISKAVNAGGTITREPEDHGYMYGHGYQDLDGHLWEVMYMDPSTVMPEQPVAEASIR